MKFRKYFIELKLYFDKPNINLNQLKQSFLLFFHSLSIKESEKAVKIMASLDFDIGNFLSIQLDLENTLNRLKRLKNVNK